MFSFFFFWYFKCLESLQKNEEFSLTVILLISIRYIRKEVVPYGQTGRVAFDDNGDRIFAEYDIINIQYGPDNNKTQVSVGQYFYPTVSLVNLTKICNNNIHISNM